ncbi:uncharacterized protein [Anabrus simplex]|uniref:uncharacterized protein n=1 Tax=Anabrus simplex TaxID=316456 RepID=UPI0034DCED32
MSSSSEEDLLFAVALLANEEEEKRERKVWVHNIYEKRETYGEFHHLFPDLLKDRSKFFHYFRMSQEKFYELLNLVKPCVERENTTFRRAVPCEERLAVCLRFLATGNSFRTLAFSYRLGETSVRRIVYDVCDAVWTKLVPIFMPQPDKEIWERNELEFRERWNFPNCVGAMDGKHVVFDKPANSGSLFYNYKKSFSIVLLALVDANYKFVMVDVGALGKNSDGGIFSNSIFGRKLQQNKLDFPPDKILPGTNELMPHVIVADEAFPLQRNLMRPYPGDESKRNTEKRIYNYRHSRARNTCEDSFGILSKKFRIYQRKMQVSPEHMTKFVLATCVLHNFLREDHPNLLAELIEEATPALQDLRGTGGTYTGSALRIRDRFKDYFSSHAGSVEWQERMINVGRRNTNE